MKTKPRRNRNIIHCNFIYVDNFLAEKVTAYFTSSQNMRVQASTAALPEHETDCYIVPVEMMQTLSDSTTRPDTWLPFIAYGSRFFLSEAFGRGCADFIKEPWECEELELRVLKLFPEDNFFAINNEEIAFRGIMAETRHGAVKLSESERKIFRTLLKNRGAPVHRDVLFYTIWNKLPGGRSRVIDVHISSLRKKIKVLFPQDIPVIHNIRKEGYQLE